MDTLRQLRDYLYGLWLQTQVKRFHVRGGMVVMITGSYGKTSVKELAYDLLCHDHEVVKTGGNYNTVVGIAKTMRWEVTKLTKLLILEVGAYHVGDITYFCNLLKPDIGVVTGIARQHLERFGSWEKIIYAKTEIVRYVHAQGGTIIANGSDETVRSAIEQATWYEGADRESINRAGAMAIASACGMSEAEIIQASAFLRLVPSRFEMTTDRYGMAVIDDSYSSNEKGFADALKHLAKQTRYTRILVTPGLVELGGESVRIHRELGRLIATSADLVILVGQNERTENLTHGIGGKVKIISIEKTLDFVKVVKNLKLKKEPLVLLENDIPENGRP